MKFIYFDDAYIRIEYIFAIEKKDIDINSYNADKGCFFIHLTTKGDHWAEAYYESKERDERFNLLLKELENYNP